MSKISLTAIAVMFGGFCLFVNEFAFAERLPDAEKNPGRLSQLAEAEVAIEGIQNVLKQELATAMSNGGAVAAMKVCHEKAPQIAQKHSSMQGLELRQTSLRWRNPANAPTAEEQTVLFEFERMKIEGQPLSSLKATIVTQEGLRYIKAIPMKGLCATCHGSNVDPTLYQTIKAYYPEDHAVGFKDGDIRGAFSILLKKVEQAKN